MEQNRREIEAWLKLISTAIYRRYTGGLMHKFRLEVVNPKSLGGALGSYYPYTGVIKISSQLVSPVWATEISQRDTPAYHPVLCKRWHELMLCGCRDKASCRAWIRLLDVLMHELIHLYCHRVHRGCNKFKGHGAHFLWYAIRLGLDLNTIFENWRETRLIYEKIKRRWNPSALDVWGTVTFVEGRIKSYLPTPESKRTDTEEPPGLPVKESSYDDNFKDLYLWGVGASG
ncbi:MAG: hypothetical protein ICV60_12850 [Pyrinomonadaceae bacterium]|nr:hypothetical protein [Pyrinomonadaceae bacterium]